MRRRFGLLVTAVAGLLAGAVIAWAMIGHTLLGRRPTTISVDGWHADLAIGSRAADPFTRAYVARVGLLALSREEAVYFQRELDDQGAPFREGCVYRINGAALPARWWSITLYASDNYLAQNNDDAHSINLAEISADAGWSALAAPNKPASGAWLSSADADGFSLTLRLYHPDAAALSASDAIDLPRVERLSCEGERT